VPRRTPPRGCRHNRRRDQGRPLPGGRLPKIRPTGTAAHVGALGDGPGPSVVQAATIGWDPRCATRLGSSRRQTSTRQGYEADTVMPQFRGDGDQPDALPAIRALTATLFAQLDERAQQIASGRLADLDVPVTVPFGEGDDYVNPGGRAPPRPPSRQRALAAGSGGVALTPGGPARRCRPPPHRGAHHDLSRSRLRTSRSRSGNRTGGGVARADDWFQELVTGLPTGRSGRGVGPQYGSALVLGFR
jgi:hypothetical protein